MTNGSDTVLLMLWLSALGLTGLQDSLGTAPHCRPDITTYFDQISQAFHLCIHICIQQVIKYWRWE